MTFPVNLFSQRVYKEHPTFNWTLQDGTNDVTDVETSAKMSASLGYPPPKSIDAPTEGTGYVWYNSLEWQRERIPMVMGSDGTTVVLPSSPRFEANRF